MAPLSLVEISGFLPGDFSRLPVADLSGRNAEDVEDLSCLRSLKRIELANNQLENLQFLHMNLQLRWIDARNNAFAGRLDLKPLMNLSELMVLNLSGNSITSVDDALSYVPNLRTLVLSHNKLKSIAGIARLENLETLILSNNQLEELPLPKKPMPNLKKMSLGSNKLKKFALSENLMNLRELRLNNNQLLTIPDDLYYSGRLEILDLGKNLLRCSISDCERLLKRCKRIKNLNLSGNKYLASSAEQWDELSKRFRASMPSLCIFNGINFSSANRAGKRSHCRTADQNDQAIIQKSERKVSGDHPKKLRAVQPDTRNSEKLEACSDVHEQKSGTPERACLVEQVGVAGTPGQLSTVISHSVKAATVKESGSKKRAISERSKIDVEKKGGTSLLLDDTIVTSLTKSQKCSNNWDDDNDDDSCYS